jgi:hypothetical protein
VADTQSRHGDLILMMSVATGTGGIQVDEKPTSIVPQAG